MPSVLSVRSLDPSVFADRLAYSFLEQPKETRGSGNDRESKTSGVVRLSNDGDAPLVILDADLSGPFALIAPVSLDGLTLAPGESIDVRIDFDRAKYDRPFGTRDEIDLIKTTFDGALSLETDADVAPVTSVQLAGFWQLVREGGVEPNLNEIWEVLGFGNRIDGLSLRAAGQRTALSNSDIYAKSVEWEVLSPYWRIADGYQEARFTQIAAYHGPGGGNIGIHAPGSVNKTGDYAVVATHYIDDNQQIFPSNYNNTIFATKTFNRAFVPDRWEGEDVFGLRVINLSSDPRLNPTDSTLIDVDGARYTPISATQALDSSGKTVNIADLDLVQRGQWVKVFEALAPDGSVIPNTYFVAQDYVEFNHDYNDNVFLIEGVEPVGFDVGGPGPQQTVTVVAGGSGGPSAAPRFRVVVDGKTIAEQAVASPQTVAEIRRDGVDYDSYDFVFAGSAPTELRIEFFNDGRDATTGEDRNLYVDKVIFGGKVYEAEIDGDFQHWNDRTDVEGPREAIYWNGALTFEASLV